MWLVCLIGSNTYFLIPIMCLVLFIRILVIFIALLFHSKKDPCLMSFSLIQQRYKFLKVFFPILLENQDSYKKICKKSMYFSYHILLLTMVTFLIAVKFLIERVRSEWGQVRSIHFSRPVGFWGHWISWSF